MLADVCVKYMNVFRGSQRKTLQFFHLNFSRLSYGAKEEKNENITVPVLSITRFTGYGWYIHTHFNAKICSFISIHFRYLTRFAQPAP